MAYQIAQLHNQHSCYRFLSSVHWASKKDAEDLKQLKTGAAVGRAKKDNDRICLQLKQERGAKAYSEWLSGKSVVTAKAEPKRCEERKKNRLTPNGSSTCTICSTIANSRGHSADSCSLKISPIKISSNQEARNIDSIGKPMKMLPYSNYSNPSQHTQPAKQPKHSKVAEKESKSSVSRTGSSRVQVNKHHRVKKLASGKMKNSIAKSKRRSNAQRTISTPLERSKSKVDGFENPSPTEVPPEIYLNTHKEKIPYTGGATDYGDDDDEFNEKDNEQHQDDSSAYEGDEEAEEVGDNDSDSDDDDDSEDKDGDNDNSSESDDDIPLPFHDNGDDNLMYPQFNFNSEDESSFFHEVGPMNDLNSLALPSVLTKGRTPAEMLQIIRHLENSASQVARPRARRSISVSGHNSTGHRSRHWNRRFSLGSIPEGEIVYNYDDGFGNEDDDRVDSCVLLNLENLIGSGRDRENDEENGADDSQSKDEGDVANQDLEHNAELSNLELQRSSETANETELNSTPAFSTLKIVNLEWDSSTNSVNSEISTTQILPPPTHRRTSYPFATLTAEVDETEQEALEKKITPTSEKATPLSEQITSPSRKLTPPSRKLTPPSRKLTPPSRKLTPPSRKVTPPSSKHTPPLSTPQSRTVPQNIPHVKIIDLPSQPLVPAKGQANPARLSSAPTSRYQTQRKRVISSAPPTRQTEELKLTPPSRKISPTICNADANLLSSIEETREDESVHSVEVGEVNIMEDKSSKSSIYELDHSTQTALKTESIIPASFSDPCIRLAASNSPRIISEQSPGHFGPVSLHKASFYIGDSDSSDEVSYEQFYEILKGGVKTV